MKLYDGWDASETAGTNSVISQVCLVVIALFQDSFGMLAEMVTSGAPQYRGLIRLISET